jgi:hypothetical protein
MGCGQRYGVTSGSLSRVLPSFFTRCVCDQSSHALLRQWRNNSYTHCFTSALALHAANQLGREITMRILSLVLVVASSATLIYGRRVEVPFGSSKFLSHRDPKLAEFNASFATGSAAATESSIVRVVTNYDPNNIASAAQWKKNVDKSGTLRCLLDMTDEQAGKQWPDPLKRVPTSASSKWKGTLQGESLELSISLLNTKLTSIHRSTQALVLARS